MSTKQPILTILMIVRNEEKHISTVLNSLLCQTYSNFIMTIIENGADDSTGAIVDNFAKQDNRITVIHLEQNDPNILFKMTDRIETIYYMFAAGHDFYDPAFIEKCLSALEADPHVVLAYPRASWIKDDKIIGDIPGVFDTRGMDSFSRSLVVAYGLIENYQFYGIYRLSAYKSVRRHIVIGNDHVMLTELAVIGSFALIDEPLFFLRMANDWGNSEVYIKKHFPDETEGVMAFLKQIDAYMSISERVTDQFDKTLLKLSLFTMCLLRYRGTLDMFNESITSMFARPDFQNLTNLMSDTVNYIEQKLQVEHGGKSTPPIQSYTTPTLSCPSKAKVKIAGEEAAGKDLTKIQEGSEFENCLRDLVISVKPRAIIETGTYIGTGTTRIIATALRDAGLVGTTFYSIECNPNHHQQALSNLGQAGLLPFVKSLLGLSVPRAVLPSIEKIYDDTVRNIVDDDIFVDHQEQNRVALYCRETDFPDIPEDLLGTCLEKFGSRPDLILLDSAGHMGSVEFNYMTERLKGECYVVLDDIHHVKHNRSFKQIQSDPRFQLLTSSREKFGFCIAKFTPANDFVADIKNMLWVRGDSIGDNILASSMLPYIKAKYQYAKITVVCQDHIAELYEPSPFVDSVISFNRQKSLDDEAYRNIFVQKLCAVDAGLVLNSLYSRDPLYDLFAINSGARTRVTFNGNLCNISADVRDCNNKLYTKVIKDNETHKPELERHRDFLEGIGISVSKLEPAIWFKPEDEEFAEKFFKDNNLDPKITMCMFAGTLHDVRIYQSYGIAISGICKKYGLSVIGLGGSDDSEINIQNLNATGVRAINLSGKTTLRQTAAILKHCRLAVGAETGLAHMACAVGTPNVILLGGGHFGRFMPYSPLTSIVCLPLECYNCNWKCRYDRVHCIRDINHKVIAEAVRQTLEKKSEKPRVFVQGTSLWEGRLQQPKWQWFNEYLDINTVEIIPIGVVPSVPKTANELYQISQEYITSGNFDLAISELEKLLEVYPNCALAHNDLGVIYYNKGDKEKALTYYERAVALNPDNINFQKNIADLYFVELGRTEEAIRIYIKVQSAHPDDIEALLAIGKFCVIVGKAKEARIFCNRVFVIDPENKDALKIIDLLNNQDKVITDEQADASMIEAVNNSEGYLVSAIVSAYNSEKFMRGKLDDLLNQTLADRIEIIVIDSNSSENEGAIVREYMAKYHNIRYLRTEERETVYQAWNRGIAMASGEFITNANTDDRLRKDCIEVLVRALCENPDKVLAYGDSIITLQENETFERCTPHDYLRWPDFDRTKLLESCFVGPHPVWRKSVHVAAGYFDVNYRCAADYEFWLRLALNHDFVHVPELLGLYWQNEGTVSRKGDAPLIEAARIQREYLPKYNRLLSGRRRINILFVLHGFPPTDVGGVEVYTQNLAKEMTSREIRVTVLYPSTDSSEQAYSITSDTFDGLTLAKFHVPRGNLFTNVSSRDLDTAFDSFLRSHTFDLVHFHHLFYNLSLSMISVAKKAALPVAITLHDFWFICPRAQLFMENTSSVCTGPENPAKCANCLLVAAWYPGISHADFEQVITVRQEYVRNLLLEVDLLFAPSRFVADIFERYGFGGGRIAVAPLGIGKFDVQRSTSEVGLRFGYMGTIHPVKNVMRLVEAFAATGGEARLDIYGGGEAFNIKMLKDSIHDPRIVYHGSYTPEQLPEILSRMDVLVAPSLIESYCLTVREALSVGIPALAARVGGIPEIVHNGVNGILFDPLDQTDLTRLLQQFISDSDALQVLNGKAIPVMTIADDTSFLLEKYSALMQSRGLQQQPIPETKVASDAQQTGTSHRHRLIQSSKKIGVAVFSFDLKEHACGHYRIHAPLKALTDEVELSWGVERTENAFQIIPGVAEDADIIIVQRFFPRPEISGFLDNLFSLGKPIIFEIDDLLTQLPPTNPSYEWGMPSVPTIYAFIRKCSAVTVTTEELRKHFSSYNDTIYILPNLLDSDLWCKTSPPSSGPVVIGYAGTITHTADLVLLEEVLGRIAALHGNKVAFTFMGCKTESISSLPGFSYIEFDTTFEAYARKLQETPIDIMLAPLEDNPFNRCKSNIKWLEYSSCGIAGVYADLPPYNSCIEHGATGLLAGNDPQQWFNAIDLLIKKPELRRSIALKARQKVMTENTLKVGAQRWLQTYREIVFLHSSRNATSENNLSVPSKKDARYPGALSRVSIIIPLYNKPEYTKKCLDAFAANTPQSLYELILVDNGSSDAMQKLLANQPATTKIIHNQKNEGFAKACNQGAKAASCEYLLFLNNDTEPQQGWLEPLMEILDNDDSVVAVGSKLLYPDGTIQHAGIVIVDDRKNGDPLLAKNNHVGKPADSPEANKPTLHQALTAACVLIRKSSFEKAGRFDEKYWNGYEDVDLCFKLQKQGGKLVYQPLSVIIHHESQSGPERFAKAPENIKRLHKKWLGKIKPDIILNKDGTMTLTNAGKIRPYSATGLQQKQLIQKASTLKPNLVSIVMLTFNELKYTRECVESINKYTPEPHEIIFIDNASTDGTVKWLRKISQENENYKLIENKNNLGFAKGCNQGIEAASGEYILLLNNDVVVTENWLSGMLECLKSTPDVGIVGPMTNNISGTQKVHDADYKTIPSMIEYAKLFRERYRHRRVPLRRIVGFCMLFRCTLVDKIGLLDESFGTGNFEDDDYCLRATLAGYQNLIAGDVFIHHYGSRSFIGNKIDYGSSISGNIQIYDEKWLGIDVNTTLGKTFTAFNFIEKAETLKQKGQLDKAISMFIEGIKYAPAEKAVYYRLAEMLLDAKLNKDALEAVGTMPQEMEDDLKRLEIIAYCTEGIEESEKLVDRILTLDKDNAAAINLKGINAYKRGDYYAAADFFKKAIAADSGYGEPYTNLGIMKCDSDQKDEALDCLEKGFILSPTLTDNVTLYHAAITALEQYGRAEKLFQDAKYLHPENKRILFFLIDIFIKQGKYDNAMHEVEQAMLDIGIDDGMLAAALEIRQKVGIKEIDKVKNKGTLSLCMIVKNEEQHLARCLLSAAPAVDEMIVVDTGSTDRTKDIARAFGAKVFDFPWTNDFSEARNVSLSKASGNWILVLDADEVISALDYPAIDKIVNKKTSKPAAYTLITRNYTNEVCSKGWIANDRKYLLEEAGTGWFPSDKVRLFVNDKRIQFQNPVHEFVETTVEKAGIEIKPSGIPVHHYGRFDKDKIISKGKEYFLLGKKKIEEMKGDTKALKELAIQASELGEYVTAVELWKRVIELNPNDSVVFLNIGYAYMKLGKYEETLISSRRAMELDPGMKEAALNYAGSEFIVGDIKKTIYVLETLLRKNSYYPPAMVLVAAAYYVDGQKERSLEIFEQLKKKRFDCTEFFDEQIRALMSQKKFEQAFSLIEAAVKTGSINDDTKSLLAECHSKIVTMHS